MALARSEYRYPERDLYRQIKESVYGKIDAAEDEGNAALRLTLCLQDGLFCHVDPAEYTPSRVEQLLKDASVTRYDPRGWQSIEFEMERQRVSI